MPDYKSPQKQIFDAVFAISNKLGYKTFDYVKPEESLPIVFIGEQSDQDQRNKSIIYGRVQQSIYVYHTIKNRSDLTDMMDRLKVEFRKLKSTENFYITCKDITAQTRIDTSTGEPLLQGFLEVEFQFH